MSIFCNLFHRSRAQVTAPLLNYQTSQILLDLPVLEHFVKGLFLRDTFNAVHFIFICIMVTCTLTCRKVTCILDPLYVINIPQ